MEEWASSCCESVLWAVWVQPSRNVVWTQAGSREEATEAIRLTSPHQQIEMYICNGTTNTFSRLPFQLAPYLAHGKHWEDMGRRQENARELLSLFVFWLTVQQHSALLGFHLQTDSSSVYGPGNFWAAPAVVPGCPGASRFCALSGLLSLPFSPKVIKVSYWINIWIQSLLSFWLHSFPVI